MNTLTEKEVREAITDTIKDIIEEYKAEPATDRETLIERLDEECDAMWGQLVQSGRIDQWDADDLANYAQHCATIIAIAKQDAWVEDDSGLWEGLTYGVVASIAYFSLRNLLYKAMADAGHDSNQDYPFETIEAE